MFVKVLRANDLPTTGLLKGGLFEWGVRAPSAYVMAKIDGRLRHTTKAVDENMNPTWDETVHL
jgi:hypothetical protein